MNQKEKYHDKYRISSARLQNYDYGQNGAYFITICTQNRECFFGEITNGEMKFSEIGKIVAAEWVKTPGIRKNVVLGDWIVLPNHFHAVVAIKNDAASVQTYNVETHSNASLQQSQYKNMFGPQSQNLSAIVRGFKGTTTKQIHVAGFQNFAWQSRFHDHIIRNKNDLNGISEYILNNPRNWESDELFLQ